MKEELSQRFRLATKMAVHKLKERKNKVGVRGTPIYLAPSLSSTKSMRLVHDAWALGCSVLEMLTGKVDLLFRRLDSRRKYQRFQAGGRNSKEAHDFLKKCLVKNPKIRSPPLICS